ncbi:hypothetical protein KAR91_32760 [Candidatus Pacearchaeota archaeon]|nr:hypothetical protein [Candidatus Pacearchaeota archaeon]
MFNAPVTKWFTHIPETGDTMTRDEFLKHAGELYDSGECNPVTTIKCSFYIDLVITLANLEFDKPEGERNRDILDMGFNASTWWLENSGYFERLKKRADDKQLTMEFDDPEGIKEPDDNITN